MDCASLVAELAPHEVLRERGLGSRRADWEASELLGFGKSQSWVGKTESWVGGPESWVVVGSLKAGLDP